MLVLVVQFNRMLLILNVSSKTYLKFQNIVHFNLNDDIVPNHNQYVQEKCFFRYSGTALAICLIDGNFKT